MQVYRVHVRGRTRRRAIPRFRSLPCLRRRVCVCKKVGGKSRLEGWCYSWVPGILLLGYIIGGLAQGRKPHGGSERPRVRPPLIFLKGGGPRPLG